MHRSDLILLFWYKVTERKSTENVSVISESELSRTDSPRSSRSTILGSVDHIRRKRWVEEHLWLFTSRDEPMNQEPTLKVLNKEWQQGECREQSTLTFTDGSFSTQKPQKRLAGRSFDFAEPECNCKKSNKTVIRLGLTHLTTTSWFAP